LKPDGEKHARLVTTHDPRIESVHESNGAKVVLRKDQVERLRGSWVDYKHSAFGTGLVVRLPDE
jgi:Fe-S cluster assembly iron-binding protein IscA